MSEQVTVIIYTDAELAAMDVVTLQAHMTSLTSEMFKTVGDQCHMIQQQINQKIFDHGYQFRQDRNNPAW